LRGFAFIGGWETAKKAVIQASSALKGRDIPAQGNALLRRPDFRA